MPIFALGGYEVLAIVVAALTVVILALFAARILRDHGVRVARVGVFVERERIVQPKETHMTSTPEPDPKPEEEEPKPTGDDDETDTETTRTWPGPR